MEQQQENYKKKFLESDSKFKTIFELTSAASKIINSDLTILKVNKAVTELLGYPEEEILGTKILDYACPEYIEYWHHLQENLWTKKMPFFKLEACLIKKDKTLVWVNVTTVLFKEDDMTYGFSILDDITYRKNFEESEKRLNLALHHSKIAVWEMDLKDFSVIRSDSHDEIFGYEKPLGKWNRETYRQHLLTQDIAGFEQAINSLKTEGVLDYKGRVYTIDKTIKWVYLQGQAELDNVGKQVKILGTIKDITREKIAEQHKDEFMSTVSHELKTPITSIKAQTQLLERKFNKAADEPTTVMLRRINVQINRLSTIIKDLLEAGSIEEQKLQMRREEYLFNEMVTDIVAEIQRTTSHQIIIENNQSAICLGDLERTGQVLSNLLTNAIKYSPGQDKVIVTVQTNEDQIICSVRDFGIGISAEKQPHVFDRFYRVSPENNNYVVSGFGLGLYISAEIIKQLQGKIWLVSSFGKGSEFYFSVPCKSKLTPANNLKQG